MLDSTSSLAAVVANASPTMDAESIPLPPSPVEPEPPSDKKLAIRNRLEKHKAMVPVRVKNFMDLPIDIKTLIVQHIIRPTDLKNLCLTSKQLHEITVRQLYHSVTLEVGSSLDMRLTDFISPKNIGLPHIRKLDLYLAEVLDKCNQLQQANFAIRMILTMLPEDILDQFCWRPWHAFSADNLQLLYRKQRRMKWLEGIALDRDNALQEMEKWKDWHADGFFKSVRKLGLYPDSVPVLDFCAALLKKSEKVEKITLHASFDEEPENGAPTMRELNDSSTGPGLISRTIFAHMMPFDKCTPLTLRDLTLQKIHLRYAADTYCKVVDFRTLKALRVFGCPGADSLFAELSKSQALPEKLETLEVKHNDNPENDLLNALDGFLCLVSGVKALTMDVCYAKTMPASAGIVRHFKTLKEVNVHASRGDGEEEELVYEAEDFQKICNNCTKIEQLSCAFPQTSVIRSPSDQFAAFTINLESIPNLITLNITTWPTNSPSNSRLPRKIYETLLQSIAQDLFERSTMIPILSPPPSPSPQPTTGGAAPPAPAPAPLGAPATPLPPTSAAPSAAPPPPPAAHPPLRKLAVIAFGASDKVYDREDSKNQITFVRGAKTDGFGRPAGPLAVRSDWCLRKYVEPRSDVLDFALSRSVRPPTREVAEEGAGEA